MEGLLLQFFRIVGNPADIVFVEATFQSPVHTRRLRRHPRQRGTKVHPPRALRYTPSFQVSPSEGGQFLTPTIKVNGGINSPLISPNYTKII